MSKKSNSNAQYLTDELVMGSAGVIIAMATEHQPSPGTKKPTTPRKANTGGSGKVALWGDSNDFPQEVIRRAIDDLGLLALLDKKSRLLQGREVIAVKEVFDPETKDMKFERFDDPEINDFLAGRRFKRYWREGCVDFTWFHNIFPDVIKDLRKNNIAHLGINAAEECRLSVQNSKGDIEHCYISPDWPNARIEDPERVLTLPVLDPYSYSIVDDFRKATYDRAIYISSYPSPGQSYYQLAPWTQYIFSEWCKIKAKIPKWKSTTMEKILSAKYVLTIPMNYWPQRFEDWKTLTPEQKRAKKKEVVKEINDQLTGIENSGSTILSEVGIDNQGKEIPAFKVIPIENALKDGQYLEDSQEAVQYMLQCLDLDPTIVGNGPGRGKDAGSGSDKRVAFNILVALLQPYRDVILEPLYFVAEYNGWTERHKGLRFKVLEVELETLDKSHKTSVVKNPVTPQAA